MPSALRTYYPSSQEMGARALKDTALEALSLGKVETQTYNRNKIAKEYEKQQKEAEKEGLTVLETKSAFIRRVLAAQPTLSTLPKVRTFPDLKSMPVRKGLDLRSGPKSTIKASSKTPQSSKGFKVPKLK